MAHQSLSFNCLCSVPDVETLGKDMVRNTRDIKSKKVEWDACEKVKATGIRVWLAEGEGWADLRP